MSIPEKYGIEKFYEIYFIENSKKNQVFFHYFGGISFKNGRQPMKPA